MNMNISEQLDENIEELKKRFKDCQDVIQRKMIAAGMPIYVVYVDSVLTVCRGKMYLNFYRNGP